jgi:hypothetical protein
LTAFKPECLYTRVSSLSSGGTILDESKFLVTDDGGEIVDVCNTAQDAKRKIADCKKNDSMWETARLLVKRAVKAHMKMHGLDRRTAHYWIREAAD